MEAAPPPPPQAGRPADPDSRPATAGEVRSLRRWLLVAGVWAVAATAIAVIALVVANRDNSTSSKDSARTAGQIGSIQRELNRRLDALDQKISGLPTSQDVSALDKRLKKVENDAGKTSDRLNKLSSRIAALESQVKALQQAGTGTNPTGTTGTTTTP